MEEEVIGIQSLDTGIGSAGVGFVVVPSDIDREQYVNDCYRTNTLTINGGKGYGYFSGVHADINVMQSIEFPTDDTNRGTPVVWVKDAISQLPVIVGVLRKQSGYYALAEKQYRLKRGTETRNVEVFLDGNEAALEITVVGDKDEAANINVKLSSANKDSVFNLNCDNEINVTAEKSVTVTSNEKATLQVTEKGKVKGSVVYELGEGFDIISEKAVKLAIRDENDEDKLNCSYEIGTGFNYKDEFGNEIIAKDGEVDIISKKINHNSGAEPMVLGTTLKGLLSDTLSAIAKLTVPTALGPSGIPINVAEFQAVLSELDTMLSKKSNLE